MLRTSVLFRPRPLNRQLASALLAIALTTIATRVHAIPSYTLGVRLDLLAPQSPARVVAGDLNGDGRVDLVVTGYYGRTVSVYLGIPNGLFAPRADYPTPAQPSGVGITDVNGDGRPDLVVECDSDTIAVLLGNGAGGFGAPRDFPTAPSANCLAIGDLNGDGWPDLVLGLYTYPGQISVMLNDGAGGFGAHYELSVGPGDLARGVALGDVNGDGNLDVLASTNLASSNIVLMLGDGAGGFGSPSQVQAEDFGAGVALSDLDDDGRLDFACAQSNGAGAVTIGFGTGSGTFTSTVTHVTGPGSDFAVAIGDVNGDGVEDFAAANLDSARVVMELGDGPRHFGELTTLPTGPQPDGIVIADVNGDGKEDIVTANIGTDSLSVFLGNGGGEFATRSVLPAGPNTDTAAIADLNGDGNPDLVVVSQSIPGVSVFLGNGNGGFSSRTDLTATGGPRGLAIADVNGDGALDIVIGNAANSTVSYFPGNGLGGFGTRVDLSTGTGTDPLSVVVADMNGDGRPDIVAGNHATGTLSILFANSSGGFNTHVDYATGPPSSSPNSIAVLPISAGGFPSMIAACPTNNSVVIINGTGPGTFNPDVLLTTASTPYAVALADLNRDGYLDLVIAEGGANDVLVLLTAYGNNLTASRAAHYPVGTVPASLAIADVNGDGYLDLVVGNDATAGTVSVLLGDGAGGFGPRTDYPVGSQCYAVAVGDLNRDGRADIVSADYASGTASILYGLRATQSRVALTPNTAVAGTPATVTATVAAPFPGLSAPSGQMSFFDGTTLLGSAPVSGGSATFNLSSPRLGVHPISARFAGDGAYLGSIALPQSLVVVPTARPTITSVADVKADQGGSIRLRFRKSPLDAPASSMPITHYDAYRQIAPGLLALARPASPTHAVGHGGGARSSQVELDGWDYVGTTPATTDSAYELVLPTLADSNTTGIHRAVFIVRAQTATPSVYFDAAPDSGYSVDNLPPPPPSPFAAAYVGGATHLHWGAVTTPDLWYYALYRGASSSFTPGPSNRIASSTDTNFVDPGPAGSWYKLSVVVGNGNESGYAVVGPGGITGADDPRLPFAVMLGNPEPNPAREQTRIRFALPRAAGIALEIYDVHGRRVRTLESGDATAGDHAPVWDLRRDDGTPAASGLYFARLRADGVTRVERFTVLR
jgi:Bacterial Ig-like domain (group 3)/FG-GAP-like repeat/FlgD Ig-like domain